MPSNWPQCENGMNGTRTYAHQKNQSLFCQSVHYPADGQSIIRGSCEDPESFVRGGPIVTTCFKGRSEDPYNTKRGPSSSHQRADDSSTSNGA